MTDLVGMNYFIVKLINFESHLFFKSIFNYDQGLIKSVILIFL